METPGTLVSGAIIGASVVLLLLEWRRRCTEDSSATPSQPQSKNGRSGGEKRKLPGILLDPKYGFRCVITRGVVYPPWKDDQENAISTLQQCNWLRDGDIVIATFPKAGTTLMQQIVMLLLNNGNVDDVGNVMVTSPWIEREYCMAKDRATALESLHRKTTRAAHRTVLKTHAPFHLFPAKELPKGSKVIVVVRDPRDVAVSMHKHYLGLPRFQYTGPLDHFVKLFLKGKVGHGCFFEHVGGWWKAYHNYGPDSILWLQYEDLISDKLGSIRKVASFIGVADDPDLFQRVLDGSDINNMREKAAKTSTQGVVFCSATHFNEGVSGRWKDKLTDAQAEQFSIRHKKFCKAWQSPTKPPLFNF